jgi:hypothetical protein
MLTRGRGRIDSDEGFSFIDRRGSLRGGSVEYVDEHGSVYLSYEYLAAPYSRTFYMDQSVVGVRGGPRLDDEVRVRLIVKRLEEYHDWIKMGLDISSSIAPDLDGMRDYTDKKTTPWRWIKKVFELY